MKNKKVLLIITTILSLFAETLSAQSSGMGTLPFDTTSKAPDYLTLTDETIIGGVDSHLVFIETFDGPVLEDFGPVASYLRDPIVTLNITPEASAGITYSLYTYKSSFPQDNKRNVLQGIQECNTTTPITTQQDIDNYLDKIYEFGADKTYTNGDVNSSNGELISHFDWDVYTDPALTGGKKYPVRDCIWFAAHDASGKLLGVNLATGGGGGSNILERHYGAIALNSTAGTKTVSADFYYVRIRPVKNFSVLLASSNCVLSNVTYDHVNKGTEQIVADMNSMDPGSIIAYKEFGSLTADGQAHVLHWNDITKINWSDPKWKAMLPAGNFPGLGGPPYYQPIPELDGKAFIPDPNAWAYPLIYIAETDNMTYTGIIDGSITMGLIPFPSPTGSNALPVVKEDQSQFKVSMMPDGYKVECDGAACIKETQVTDILGRVLVKKTLPPETKTAQVPVALQPGQIYVVSNTGDDGKPVSVKVIAVKR